MIRAPNDATFGPNSFAAAVSITTRAPAARSGWFVDSEAGDNEFRSGTLSYDGAEKDFNYSLTMQGERDEDFRNIPDKERSKLASVKTHTPRDTCFVWVIHAERELCCWRRRAK